MAKTESDTNQIAYISDQIKNALPEFFATTIAAATAKAAAAEASGLAWGARGEVLLTLAGMSAQGEWSEGEIGKACFALTKTYNDTTNLKNLQNFLAEAKRAMLPKVRHHASFLATLCSEAWEAEEMSDPGDDRPVRRAFGRKYAMILRAFSLAASGTLLTTQEDIAEWARQNDPRHDAEKVAKKLKTMRDQCDAFFGEFPAEGFQHVKEYLEGLNETTLMEARKAKILRERGAIAEAPSFGVATPPPVVPEAPRASTSVDDAMDDLVPSYAEAA